MSRSRFSRGNDVLVGFTNRGYVCAGGVLETVRAGSHQALPMVAYLKETRTVCFEPGIAKRDGGGGRFVTDKSTTLRANAGDNRQAVAYDATPPPAAFMGGQGAKARTIAYTENVSPSLKSVPSGGNTIPDVVYPINTMVATRGGRDDMRTCFGIGEPGDPQFTLSSAHEHAVAYCIQGVGDTSLGSHGKGWMGDFCYTVNTLDKHAVCYGIDANSTDSRFKLNESEETFSSADKSQEQTLVPMALIDKAPDDTSIIPTHDRVFRCTGFARWTEGYVCETLRTFNASPAEGNIIVEEMRND